MIIFEFYNGTDNLKMDDTDFVVLDYSGIESSDYELTTAENLNNIGERIINRKILPRPITIEFEYEGYSERGKMRDYLIDFFNPLSSGTLKVTYMETVREVAYEVRKLTFSSKNVNDYLTGLAELTCVDPAFLAEYTTSEQIATWIGGWQWKFSLPLASGRKEGRGSR